ncbi:ArsR/SmtB family transcription factor [Salinicola avicenniae]|uniref:ArsR/SmtB family transcription factor n=1 Tax=Salinicola avicenniae TaxID=2916836 RepID=UPI0020736204|nr:MULTISPECIES: helix-turn-helix transcriptional regulator [unclassified Salinicola]
METQDALDGFAALSQQTRLEAFRLLIRHEPAGLAAGEIARLLAVPHNTMSAHLAVLARAGLIVSQRQSRSIIYRAHLAEVGELIGFLVSDCCAGHPEVCASLQSAASDCCSSDVASHPVSSSNSPSRDAS